MRAIGMGASALVAAVLVSAVVVAVRSIPDVKRYLAIRQM
jgi:hypothetical protein